MTRRARAGIASLTALVLTLCVGYGAFTRARAERSVHAAEALLFTSLVDAPELTGIYASRARLELEQAASVPFTRDVSGLLAYARALEALERGDLPEATSQAERAASRLGRTADVHVLEGTIARTATRIEDATASVHAALRIAPDHHRAQLLDADLALDRGDGARAVSRLTHLCARVPEVGALHARLGRAYELVGDVAAAERAYRAALARDGRDPSTFVNLGRVTGLQGDLHAARDAFAQAKLLAPDDARAWLGECLTALTASDDAALTASCARAAALDVGAPEALIALGDAARAHADLATAISYYEGALTRVPSHAGAHTKLGHVRFAMGRLDEAEASYRAAIDASPRLAAAHNGLGVVLGMTGREDEARVTLAYAASLDDRDASPLMNLGLLAERTGDRADARRAFEAALERDPSNETALTRLLRL